MEVQRVALWKLSDSFGDDVAPVRADRGEEAFRIHAVIVPRVTVDVGNADKVAKRPMLQPSQHALICDYEKAHDGVGEAFAGIGLVRGDRRRAAHRQAMRAGTEPQP